MLNNDDFLMKSASSSDILDFKNTTLNFDINNEDSLRLSKH
jgi:hypothetical protein